MARLHLHRLGTLLYGVLPVLLLAGCGEEPTPPRLTGFVPAVLAVPANEALEVSVIYEANDARLEDFQWRVEAGEIEGNGAPTVTYRAPEQPGNYGITVTAAYGDDGDELSLDAVVKVTQAIATEPPAVAEATEADTEAAAAIERAEAPEPTAGADEEGAPAAGTDTTDAPEPARTPDEAIDRARQALEEVRATATAEVGREGAATEQPPEQQTSELAEQDEPAEAPTSDETAAGSRLDQILERRRLIALVQLAFEPFSFYGADGRRTGFEIDFLHEFARRWLDDPMAVTYLPVPSDARIPTLQRGRADLIAAALTKTPERAEQVDFSLIYFKDGQRLLVPEASEVAGVCDLEGRQVAAVEGSTSIDNIQAAAADCGFELGDDLITFRRHDDAVQAVLGGEVDAFTSDGVALRNLAEGQPLKVVGDPFSEEPYGFAVPKGDDRLRQRINETLRQMAQDGTYAAIYERWFGAEIPPYPLSEAEAPVAATEAPAGQGEAPVAQADAPADQATAQESAAVEPAADAAETIDTYVVQPGDTLSKIAREYYGDAWATSWQRIHEANRDVIGDDPGRLKVGTTLEIPE